MIFAASESWTDWSQQSILILLSECLKCNLFSRDRERKKIYSVGSMPSIKRETNEKQMKNK